MGFRDQSLVFQKEFLRLLITKSSLWLINFMTEQLPRWPSERIFPSNKFVSAINVSKTLHQINARNTHNRRKLYLMLMLEQYYLKLDPRSESTTISISLYLYLYLYQTRLYPVFWPSFWALIIWADKSVEIKLT